MYALYLRSRCLVRAYSVDSFNLWTMTISIGRTASCRNCTCGERSHRRSSRRSAPLVTPPVGKTSKFISCFLSAVTVCRLRSTIPESPVPGARSLSSSSFLACPTPRSCLMCVSCHPVKPAVVAAGSFNGEVRPEIPSQVDERATVLRGVFECFAQIITKSWC